MASAHKMVVIRQGLSNDKMALGCIHPKLQYPFSGKQSDFYTDPTLKQQRVKIGRDLADNLVLPLLSDTSFPAASV